MRNSVMGLCRARPAAARSSSTVLTHAESGDIGADVRQTAAAGAGR